MEQPRLLEAHEPLHRPAVRIRDANAEWCEFIAEKIRGIVEDPETAEKLIPKDHRFGEKRPPFVTGYYETYNKPNVSLVDLKQTPIVRMTERGIETADGVREFDIVVWATGFDFGTGALARMGIRGRNGLALDGLLGRRPEDVPRRADRRLPELLLPRWPARGGRQQPALQRRPGRLRHRHARVRRAITATTRSRSTPRPKSEWTNMVDTGAAMPPPFGESSYFFGTQHPRQAAPVPPELRRPAQALQGDRRRPRERLQGVQTVATG